MSEKMGELESAPGALLRTLLEEWRREHGRRDGGGWWALAGFSFQAGIFLHRFFENLQPTGNHEPGHFAEMERLSDILCPADGYFMLIQSKRPLSRSTLAKALEEAYLITELCLRTAPALLPRLRFQIACREVSAGCPVDLETLGKEDLQN